MQVWQEFYCRKAGGGCGGYILVRLSLELNRRIIVVCPSCGHCHQRYVENGEIKDTGARNDAKEEVFTPLKSAWSATPRTKVMATTNKTYGEGANAAVIKKQDDLVASDSILRESWFERFAGRAFGATE